MSEYEKFGKNLMEAFPTKEERQLAKGEISKIPTRPLYVYWTNYDRNNPEFFDLFPTTLHADPTTNTWQFRTNITPADMDTWEIGRLRAFLTQMWNIYRYRKAEVDV